MNVSGPFRVALLVETSNAYARSLLQGIRAWMRSSGPWIVHLSEQGRGSSPPPWLTDWDGDGILVRIETSEIEAQVRATGLPTINLSATGLGPEYPSIISNSAAVARLAAEHLLDRGFRNFGYCGDARHPWSATHGHHFATFLAASGYSCSVFESRPDDLKSRESEQQRLGDWVGGLPKPVGIMTCNDTRGHFLLTVCRLRHQQVPDQVAVIGQHNDELLCDLCDPPLSSVIPNPFQAGFQAAAWLDTLLRECRPRRSARFSRHTPARVRQIDPLGVAVRQSTDTLAIPDKKVAAAIRFIRAHACEGIHVPDVLKAVPMARTLLERKFQQYLGRTPYAEIQRTRLTHASALLAETDLPITTIAERCGFTNPEYFSTTFLREMGKSPSVHRRETGNPSVLT